MKTQIASKSFKAILAHHFKTTAMDTLLSKTRSEFLNAVWFSHNVRETQEETS